MLGERDGTNAGSVSVDAILWAISRLYQAPRIAGGTYPRTDKHG